MFSYCKNNPVNMYDPIGCWPKWLSCVCSVLAGVGEIFAGSALVLGGGPLGWVAGTLLIVHGLKILEAE